MTKISYSVGKENGTIYWSAAEEFSELKGKSFKLGEMEATEIEKMENFSLIARILLSAVAGATIQHLLDKNIDSGQIFQHGIFTID